MSSLQTKKEENTILLCHCLNLAITWRFIVLILGDHVDESPCIGQDHFIQTTNLFIFSSHKGQEEEHSQK
jgi:hypothetical protein